MFKSSTPNTFLWLNGPLNSPFQTYLSKIVVLAYSNVIRSGNPARPVSSLLFPSHILDVCLLSFRIPPQQWDKYYRFQCSPPSLLTNYLNFRKVGIRHCRYPLFLQLLLWIYIPYQLFFPGEFSQGVGFPIPSIPSLLIHPLIHLTPGGFIHPSLP